jgi:hypothetical protein
MHGYIVKNQNCRQASNDAGWRPKMGENTGVKSDKSAPQ